MTAARRRSPILIKNTQAQHHNPTNPDRRLPICLPGVAHLRYGFRPAANPQRTCKGWGGEGLGYSMHPGVSTEGVRRGGEGATKYEAGDWEW